MINMANLTLCLFYHKKNKTLKMGLFPVVSTEGESLCSQGSTHNRLLGLGAGGAGTGPPGLQRQPCHSELLPGNKTNLRVEVAMARPWRTSVQEQANSVSPCHAHIQSKEGVGLEAGSPSPSPCTHPPPQSKQRG